MFRTMCFQAMSNPKKSWRSPVAWAVSVLALIVVISGAALAGEKQPKSDLPGVDTNYSIVKPAPPEPEPERQPKDSTLRLGEWDVKISGTITFDVTTGKLPPPRR